MSRRRRPVPPAARDRRSQVGTRLLMIVFVVIMLLSGAYQGLGLATATHAAPTPTHHLVVPPFAP